MKIVTKEKTINHPMEGILDLDPGTTIVEYKEAIPEDPVEHVRYDEKDGEIETKIEEIYTAAMSSVVTMSDEMERVEGKYKARMGEVSATMLNVALGAVREKRELKQHKDKLSASQVTAAKNVTNNNLIVADRNEILRVLADKNK